MLTPLVDWLREQQVEIEQGVFDSPPKDWADFQGRLAERNAFRDVLVRIDELQKAEEKDDDRK